MPPTHERRKDEVFVKPYLGPKRAAPKPGGNTLQDIETKRSSSDISRQYVPRASLPAADENAILQRGYPHWAILHCSHLALGHIAHIL